MNEIDLEAIEARANAATEGPWVVEEGDMAGHNVYLDDPEPGVAYIAEELNQGYDDGKADAEFVAHARTDIPALVAEVRRLRERLIEQENA